MNTDPAEWIDLLLGNGTRETRMPMLSGSMSPALLPGDIIVVRPRQGRAAHVGDIIIFREEGKLIAHRLILAFRFGLAALLVEKGDANRTASLVRERNIVGIAVAAYRDGRILFDRGNEGGETGRSIARRGLLRLLLLDMPIGIFAGIKVKHARI